MWAAIWFEIEEANHAAAMLMSRVRGSHFKRRIEIERAKLPGRIPPAAVLL